MTSPMAALPAPLKSRSEATDGHPHDKSEIAELTGIEIGRMTCSELVGLIRAAELPASLRPGLDRRLEFLDREQLSRLAFLARRCCRNQGY